MTTYLETVNESLPSQHEITRLGPWFHNLHINGVQTAPAHPLGDFPRNKWSSIAPFIPESLTGWTALDIGCNAGFYSFELAKRGAKVTAIDLDSHYLRQAHWAARQLQLEEQITFQQMQLYQLANDEQQFDLIWFMGVFYHLRYPQLALDIVARRTRRLMLFQTMTIPGDLPFTPPHDVPLHQREKLCDPAWPRLAFIEKRVAGDPTNWWAPNHACVEGMLRSSGFRIIARPAHEVYLCAPCPEEQYHLGIDLLIEAEYLAATGRG